MELTEKRQKDEQKYWYLQYWIYYNKKIADYENIYSDNLFYWMISKVNGYIEKKMEVNT